MLRVRLAALTAAVVLFVSSGAHADESRFADRFFRGTSPGELPTAKMVTVGTLYVVAVASVSLGAVSLVQAGDRGRDADAYKHDQAPGFCNDLASASCANYRSLLDEERSKRNVGLVLLGSGGLLALAGALTAELWHNELPRVALDVRPGALTLSVSGAF
jgi:hypothetical protein